MRVLCLDLFRKPCTTSDICYSHQRVGRKRRELISDPPDHLRCDMISLSAPNWAYLLH